MKSHIEQLLRRLAKLHQATLLALDEAERELAETRLYFANRNPRTTSVYSSPPRRGGEVG